MVFLLLVFSVILSFFGYSAFTDAVAEKRADGRQGVCKGCGAVRRADHDVYEIQKTAATVSCACSTAAPWIMNASFLYDNKEIRMKKVLILCFAFALLLTGCGKKTNDTGPAVQQAAEPFQKTRHAEISVRDYGTIKLELDEGSAPITVANFVRLAGDGFYDGLTFHRIMDGFMIQGGDPDGNGTGGSSEKIKGEFSQNGVSNPISHVKGVISMARANDPDSASSQFFITVADSTFLDGSYAAFGRVTDGMDVAERIAKDAKPVDNNGTIPPEQQPVIERIVITD